MRNSAIHKKNCKMTEENKEFVYDSEKNYDEAIMEQQRNIEQEIAQNQELIGPQLDLDSVAKEYSKEDEKYLKKIGDLKKRYKCIRRTRGDGNCFYRGFGFAYMEKLISDKSDFERFKNVVDKSKDELVGLGFPQFTVEDFHDNFMDVVNKVGNEYTVTELLSVFNDQGLSDYLVVYLRLLVSGYLQKEEDFYSSFVEGHRTMKEFCNQEVEPMGKECDHLQVLALTSTLGVSVRIEYMDRCDKDACNHHDFPEGSQPSIYLLYRPGHYDVIYP